MKVPVIDFEEYDSGDPQKLAALTGELDSALSKIGFMSLTNLGIEPELLRQVFAASRDFFHGDLSTKTSAIRVCANSTCRKSFWLLTTRNLRIS